MTNTISLSIIIPTYNAKPFLSHTVEAVLKSKARNYEIIIVDNASSDGTIWHLKKTFSRYLDKINFLRLDKNYGPAKASKEKKKTTKTKK